MDGSELTWTDDSPAQVSFFNAVSSNDINGLKSIIQSGVAFNINILRGDGIEGLTALHLACLSGYTEIVQLLLENGASPNCRNADPYGTCPPLHTSSAMGHVEVTQLLLDYGADLTALDGNGSTALELVFHHYPQAPATSSSRLVLYQMLLNRGPRNASGGPFLTERQLHSAVMLPDISVLQILLDNGHDLHVPDLEGTRSILCSATASKSIELMQLLIDHGAQVKNDALEWASHSNQEKILDFLLHHSNQSIRSTCDALHIACSYGDTHLKSVRMLLENAWDVNRSDSRGDYPLLLTCGSSHDALGVVSLLLEVGADISIRSHKPYKGSMIKGDTTLHRAAWRCNPNVVEKLLAAGADVAAVNDAGETPLIIMADNINRQFRDIDLPKNTSNPRLTVIGQLLEARSDVDVRDLQGRTAAHVLVSNKYAELVPGLQVMVLRKLLDAGAMVYSTGANGESLLHIAHRNRKQDIVDLLTEFGHTHK